MLIQPISWKLLEGLQKGVRKSETKKGFETKAASRLKPSLRTETRNESPTRVSQTRARWD